MRRLLIGAALLAAGALTASTTGAAAAPHRAAALPGPAASPIKHIVVLLQENHSHDNVLGTWCVQTGRCQGVAVGDTVQTTAGPVVVRQASDYVLPMAHAVADQQAAWDNGKDDGWPKVGYCGGPAFNCISGYTPAQLPTITGLANTYALSDQTRTFALQPSWADHFEWFTSGDADGFYGDIPHHQTGDPWGAAGWGCDADLVSPHSATGAAPFTEQPSCIPDPRSGKPNGGAFKPTTVETRKSLAEDCDVTANCTWKVYNTDVAWNPVHTFGYLLYKDDHSVKTDQFKTDAKAGTLPALSFLTPSFSGYATDTSQHNAFSMAAGDNAIQDAVKAAMTGPEADSTAVFITYDDCGCFYDSVDPRRVPMVIVSPWVKPGYSDHTVTDFNSVVRFAEITLGMPSLNAADATAYPYEDAFDFTPGRTLVKFPTLGRAVVPWLTKVKVAAHPSAAKEATDDDS